MRVTCTPESHNKIANTFLKPTQTATGIRQNTAADYVNVSQEHPWLIALQSSELKLSSQPLLVFHAMLMMKTVIVVRFPSRVSTFMLGRVLRSWGRTTKWIPTPLVVLLKRTSLCTFGKFLEALNVGLVEWK